MIKLAIVIPVFNALEYTKRCLGELKGPLAMVNYEKFNTSIVVIDDGSTDGSGEWIRKNYPEVIVCQGDGNLWWSGGVNMGIHYAIETLNTDYILLWNNDIRPSTNYFTCLFDILISNPLNNIILSSIYVDNQSERIIFSMGGNFNMVNGKHSLIGFGKKAESFIKPDLEINWFPGMGTVIHTTVFNEIGFFDAKHFPQYEGDADFALRAFKAGYKLTLYTQLEIWNDRENTGFSNDKSWMTFIRSLTSRKSSKNIYRDILFYNRHGKSIFVYRELFRKYFFHIAGFFKWKFLKLFGLQRKNRY